MWRFVFCFFIISISFFSCSNAAAVQEPEPVEAAETLKNVITGKESNISWTGELEGDRLLADVYRDIERIASDIALSPAVVNVAYDNSGDGVYPELLGFGSLDTRSLSSDLRVFVEDFCKAFSKNIYDGPDWFFDEKYFFNYVFFRNELVYNWEKMFGVPFPQEEAGKEADGGEDAPDGEAGKETDGGENDADGEAGKEADGGENDADGEAGKETDGGENDVIEKVIPPLFTEWQLGAPVNSGEILQQPIRFYCNDGYVDFILYIRLDNKKIYQISRGAYGK